MRSMGRFNKTLRIALAVCVMTIVAWPQVAADASMPTSTTEEVTGAHFLSGVCGIEIQQAGTIYTTVHDVGDGHLVFDIRADIVLSSHGWLAFERPAFTAQIDPGAGTVSLEGTLVNISAPVEGILLKDVGRESGSCRRTTSWPSSAGGWSSTATSLVSARTSRLRRRRDPLAPGLLD